MPPVPAPARVAALSPVCRIGARRASYQQVCTDIRPVHRPPALTGRSARRARLGRLAPVASSGARHRHGGPQRADPARPGMPVILLADRPRMAGAVGAALAREFVVELARDGGAAFEALASGRHRACGSRHGPARRSAGWRCFAGWRESSGAAAAGAGRRRSRRHSTQGREQPMASPTRSWPCPAPPASCCAGSGGWSTARWSGAGTRLPPLRSDGRRGARAARPAGGARPRRRRARGRERAPAGQPGGRRPVRAADGRRASRAAAHHDYTFAHSFRVATHLATFALAVGMRRATPSSWPRPACCTTSARRRSRWRSWTSPARSTAANGRWCSATRK